jgi:hypothetical protein
MALARTLPALLLPEQLAVLLALQERLALVQQVLELQERLALGLQAGIRLQISLTELLKPIIVCSLNHPVCKKTLIIFKSLGEFKRACNSRNAIVH